MSRDTEDDIIDVDGSDAGDEEEYEVESITGFKWEVSVVWSGCEDVWDASLHREECAQLCR